MYDVGIIGDIILLTINITKYCFIQTAPIYKLSCCYGFKNAKKLTIFFFFL